MNEYDVKRLIEMEAINAEIEAMKIANKESWARHQPRPYSEADFNQKAEELRTLASKHNHQL